MKDNDETQRNLLNEKLNEFVPHQSELISKPILFRKLDSLHLHIHNILIRRDQAVSYLNPHLQ